MFMSTTILGIKATFPSVHNISTDTLSQWIQEKADLKLLDCRPEEEFKVSHIADAKRVDPEAKKELLTPVLDDLKPDSKVVCYCSLGYRSCMVAQKIQSAAKEKNIQVFNLEGSLFKWANENRPMCDSNGEKTIFAHPFNSVFGKLLKSELWKRESSL